MPANRRPVARQDKQDEIVRVAAGLFTDVGFDETSMAQLSAGAGVTTNTVYWYFEDKDALLVAVLDLLLAEALAEQAQQSSLPWDEQVLWALGRLQAFSRLVSVVHARAASSPAVAAWHEQFHTLADQLLTAGFREAGVAEEDLAAATRIGTFAIEGLLSHPQDEAEQQGRHLTAHHELSAGRPCAVGGTAAARHRGATPPHAVLPTSPPGSTTGPTVVVPTLQAHNRAGAGPSRLRRPRSGPSPGRRRPGSWAWSVNSAPRSTSRRASATERRKTALHSLLIDREEALLLRAPPLCAAQTAA